jgi:molecular chaperone GrpE
MPDPNTPDNNDAPGAAPGPTPQQPPSTDAAPAADGEPEIAPAQLKEIIAALQTDLEGLQGQNLRLIADMDNLRKRSEREKADTAKYAVTKFAHDIVGVVDNFERAAAAVPGEAAEKDPALKSFLDGVLLAEREFLSVLERHGVRRIEAQGQPFNPHQHQAVMEREDQSVPAGTVLQVFQAGFMIEDRCLRPAMVVVSGGGQKAARPAQATAGTPTEEQEPEGSGEAA